MSKFKRKDEVQLCKCGCGERTKKSQNYKGYNKYINGHNSIGKKRVLTKEHRKQISIAQKKNSFFHIYNKTKEHSKKVSESNRKRKLSKETKKRFQIL